MLESKGRAKDGTGDRKRPGPARSVISPVDARNSTVVAGSERLQAPGGSGWLQFENGQSPFRSAGACRVYVGGIDSTSNVLASRLYGIPGAGTMAHSYVQAHRGELEAFLQFSRSFPQSTLLVDTYDTLEGVRKVIRLARELGSACRVRAVRLDSGDLGSLARERAGRAGVGKAEMTATWSGGRELIRRDSA